MRKNIRTISLFLSMVFAVSCGTGTSRSQTAVSGDAGETPLAADDPIAELVDEVEMFGPVEELTDTIAVLFGLWDFCGTFPLGEIWTGISFEPDQGMTHRLKTMDHEPPEYLVEARLITNIRFLGHGNPDDEENVNCSIAFKGEYPADHFEILSLEPEAVEMYSHLTDSIFSHISRADLRADDPQMLRVESARVEGDQYLIAVFRDPEQSFGDDPNNLYLHVGSLIGIPPEGPPILLSPPKLFFYHLFRKGDDTLLYTNMITGQGAGVLINIYKLENKRFERIYENFIC